MIQIENLKMTYRSAQGVVHAVQDVTLEVKQGEFYTLLGPSGCGKTTTLRCVAGLERPESGKIVVNNKVVYSSAEGILVNHTLGFSARQNYVATRLASPAYVNVFLGRLGSFVRDNDLGDGLQVGEKAALASQAAVARLRSTRNTPTLQIGASFRGGRQVVDLAGIDVMTIPPAVAGEYLELTANDRPLPNHTRSDFEPTLREGVSAERIGLDTLWHVDLDLVECVDEVLQNHPDQFRPADLVDFFHDRGCGDVFPRWTEDQIALSAAEGKIPRLENWQDALGSGEIGLDSLMNLAGLNSFTADQRAMDDRIETVLRDDDAGGQWRA